MLHNLCYIYIIFFDKKLMWWMINIISKIVILVVGSYENQQFIMML